MKFWLTQVAVIIMDALCITMDCMDPAMCIRSLLRKLRCKSQLSYNSYRLKLCSTTLSRKRFSVHTLSRSKIFQLVKRKQPYLLFFLFPPQIFFKRKICEFQIRITFTTAGVKRMVTMPSSIHETSNGRENRLSRKALLQGRAMQNFSLFFMRLRELSLHQPSHPYAVDLNY